MSEPINYLKLSVAEIDQINRLLDKIFSGHDQIPTEPLLLEARLWADQLPERVRRFFYQFKLLETSLGICVNNAPFDNSRIGKTPAQIPGAAEKQFATREEVLHMLFGSLLGEVFTWASIQNGSIINEIVPIAENEARPISSGSRNLFDFHTEDAFHPYMEDYVGLMCLRNPDQVSTVISSLDGIDLPPEVKRVLFEPRFLVSANIAHDVPKLEGRVPLLFGHPDTPYLRINLNVPDNLEGDKEAQGALEVLIEILRANAFNFILQPGDCLYLDNFRAVHGRMPYTPRYDGTDRWLKRIYITSYLRKSRDMRNSPQSRLITFGHKNLTAPVRPIQD